MAKIAAQFAVTHRERGKAPASFKAMLKEAPRLALWAAAKHPQAFGEQTGREGPGIGWREVRPLVAAASRESTPRPVARGPLSQDAAVGLLSTRSPRGSGRTIQNHALVTSSAPRWLVGPCIAV
jgi:hypothetical protein